MNYLVCVRHYHHHTRHVSNVRKMCYTFTKWWGLGVWHVAPVWTSSWEVAGLRAMLLCSGFPMATISPHIVEVYMCMYIILTVYLYVNASRTIHYMFTYGHTCGMSIYDCYWLHMSVFILHCTLHSVAWNVKWIRRCACASEVGVSVYS